MNNHKDNVPTIMQQIYYIVNTDNNDKSRWYKINWIIVSSSHNIFKSRGLRGHKIRQKIRHNLWHYAKKRYPILKRYRIPREIKGNSKCKIKIYYRILDRVNIFKKWLQSL